MPVRGDRPSHYSLSSKPMSILSRLLGLTSSIYSGILAAGRWRALSRDELIHEESRESRERGRATSRMILHRVRSRARISRSPRNRHRRRRRRRRRPRSSHSHLVYRRRGTASTSASSSSVGLLRLCSVDDDDGDEESGSSSCCTVHLLWRDTLAP